MNIIETKAQELINLVEAADKLKAKIDIIKAEKLAPLSDELKVIDEQSDILRKELANLLVENNQKEIKVGKIKLVEKTTLNKIVIKDDVAVINWIKSQKSLTNKDWIKISETLEKTKFKKFVELKLAELEKGHQLEIAGVDVVDEHTVAVMS